MTIERMFAVGVLCGAVVLAVALYTLHAFAHGF